MTGELKQDKIAYWPQADSRWATVTAEQIAMCKC